MTALLEREGALQSADRFLDRLPHSPAVLALEGEPGMGKTAVWLETVDAAGRRGYRTLQARPAESEASLAYAGITDLVSPVFDDVVAALPTPQSAALAGALLRGDTRHPIEFRAVATAVGSVLSHLALARPVVVAVDDVQWLDPVSARVLAFVARRMAGGVGLLLAERRVPGEARSALSDSLSQELVDRTALAPLSAAAVRTVVRSRVSSSIPRTVLTRLTTASGGNPLFALEIGHALEERPPGEASGPLPVPVTLQRMVASRVDALSAATREALLVTAALSRPTTTMLAQTMGKPPADGALAEAVRADVVTTEQGRIRFVHPLFASAVYGTASPSSRRSLHRRLADVVEDPDERARHVAVGVEGPDHLLAGELEQAAVRAARRGAPETAVELFEAACRLTPADAREDRARRILGQADALDAAGDAVAARAAAELTLSTARTTPLRTSALLLLAGIAWYDGDAATATRHAGRALALPGQDRQVLAHIHAQLVRLSFSLDLGSALEHADRALALLDGNQPDRLAQVLIDRVFGSALHGDAVPEGLLDRALRLEESSADEETSPSPMPLLWFQCTDDVEAARRRCGTEERWHRERGEEVWVADRLSHLAVAELRAGDVTAARRHADQACAAIEGLHVTGPRAMVFEKRALVDAHLGRLDRARDTAERLLDEHERTGQGWWAALTLSTLAFIEYVAGDGRAADRAVQGMGQRADRVGAVDVLFDRSEPFHIEALLDLGDTDRAREVLARLEERGRRLPRPWIAASLPRSRALVMAAEGDLDAALAMLSEPAAEPDGSPPFEVAWTLLVRGRLERRAKRKRAAADTLQAAVAAFELLQAPDFASRARSELARVGLHRAGAGLSPTELLIARFAAGGMTNREVASAAFVSPKTVEANLARVYRKLGIHSRAELGSHMAREEASPRP